MLLWKVTILGVGVWLVLLGVFYVLRRGKDSESPPPFKMSSPGRAIVKPVTGSGVPASPSAACRYEARNDALRSIVRSRSLTKEDAAALMDYIVSTNDSMRAECAKEWSNAK